MTITTDAPRVLPAQPPKRATCKKCGKGGLVWKKSKADRWYLSEEVFTQSTRSGRFFRNQRLHKCPSTPLNPEPQQQAMLVVGRPHIAPQDCGAEHRWVGWRAAPGSQVWGRYCLGCGDTMID